MAVHPRRHIHPSPEAEVAFQRARARRTQAEAELPKAQVLAQSIRQLREENHFAELLESCIIETAKHRLGVK